MSDSTGPSVLLLVFAFPSLPYPARPPSVWDASVGGKQLWSEEAEQLAHSSLDVYSRKYYPQHLVLKFGMSHIPVSGKVWDGKSWNLMKYEILMNFNFSICEGRIGCGEELSVNCLLAIQRSNFVGEVEWGRGSRNLEVEWGGRRRSRRRWFGNAGSPGCSVKWKLNPRTLKEKYVYIHVHKLLYQGWALGNSKGLICFYLLRQELLALYAPLDTQNQVIELSLSPTP